MADLLAAVEPRAQAPETDDPMDLNGAMARERVQASRILAQMAWWRDSASVLQEMCHAAVQLRHR